MHPKHSKLIDLANIGCLTDGWVGAAEIQIRERQILCYDGEYVMPSAVVVNRVPPGVTPLGDETRAYEAFPIKSYCIPQCFFPLKSTVVTDEAGGTPIVGATVTVTTTLWCADTWTGSTTTGTDGKFSLNVPGVDDQAAPYEAYITAAKTGYVQLTVPLTTTARIACDYTRTITDVVVFKGATLSGRVWGDADGDDTLDVPPGPDERLADATVELWLGTKKLDSVTTDAQGVYSLVGLDDRETYTIKASKGAHAASFAHTPTARGVSDTQDIRLY